MSKWLALLLAAAAILAGAALFPPNVFWITDEGTKFIQLQSLSRFGGIEVVYPGRTFDPALRLLPDAGHHLIRLGPHVVSLFLPYFALLNVIPFRLFGIRGIYLMPAAGALITPAVTMTTARRLGIEDRYGFIPSTLLFGTPLFFYAITYWEHTLALALSTTAIVVLMRSPVRGTGIAAGVLLAASTLLREEGYILVIAVVLALLVRDRNWRIAALILLAFAVTMTPFWLWHLHLFGSVLGLHGAVYASYASQSTARVRAFFDYLLRFRAGTALSLLLVAPQLAAIVMPRRWRQGVLVLACLTALAAPLLLALDADPILATADAKGLLPALPFITLALLAWREADRFLGSICILFIAGACLNLSSAGTWIIWGPRHFLPIVPLLVVLAADGWNRIGRPAVAAVLIAASLFIQCIGISDLAIKKRGSERILQAIVAEQTSVVVTDVFWLPQEMASLFYGKTFLLAKSDADAVWVVAALRARGIDRFTFVAARHYRTLSNKALAPIIALSTRRTRVVTPGMEFMDVMLLSCDLRRGR